MPNLLINGLSWAAKIIQFSIFLWPLNYELESFAVSELMKLKQKENLKTRKARSVPFIGSKARNENIYIYQIDFGDSIFKKIRSTKTHKCRVNCLVNRRID